MKTNLSRNFFKYTTSNMLAMLGVSFYVLADTFFIARVLGPVGLTSLNFAIVIFSLMHGIGLMLGTGGAIDFSVKTSREGGSGHESFMSALTLAALFSLGLVLIGALFSKEISLFLGADETTFASTQTYIRTLLYFSPFFILNNIFLAFVRNDNNPTLSMNATLISSMANITLDYIFMFPLGLGMFGAVLATGLSPVLSLMILMFHFKGGKSRFKLHIKKPDVPHLKRIIKLGTPSLITELAAAITMFTFNIVILGLAGNIGVAAYGVIANVAVVATALYGGLAQGVQPLASRYFAVGDKESLKHTLKYGVVTALTIAFLLAGGILIFSEQIVAVFNGENNLELATIANQGIRIYFMGFFFGGLNILSISYLSAILKTREAVGVSVLRSSLVLIPMVLLLSQFLGLTGVWLSFIVTEFVVVLLTIIGILHSRKNRSLA